MIINRKFAYPTRYTFSSKPIKELLSRYINSGMCIIDPFANNSKLGTITNDLNPEFNTNYHLHALDFLKIMKSNSADMILFDPPYSFRQATECYKSFGASKLKHGVTNERYWADCKNEISRIIKINGICISFGWNSNGLGRKRGFDILEILLLAHGGHKNDTIVLVEKNAKLF